MATSNNDSLPWPVSKRNPGFVPKYPFPIISSDCGFGQPDPKWNYHVGYFKDNCVLVHDEESIKILYFHGYYGKGNLSKSAPKFCCRKKYKTSENCQTTSSASAQDDNSNKLDDGEKSAADNVKQEDIELVLSDSSDSDCEKKSSSLKKEDDQEIIVSDDKESLQLSFEEAYFLSFALGCLVVKDNKNQPLDLARLWDKCCRASPNQNFSYMYIAYNHFRTKGWVVKSGIKYGVDYVLYKDGPPFHHATYSVIVKPVIEKNYKEIRESRNLSWGDLFALQRLNNSVGKTLMFFYVIKPSNISQNKMSTPFCIPQYKVKEVLFERWVPSQNREVMDLDFISDGTEKTS